MSRNRLKPRPRPRTDQPQHRAYPVVVFCPECGPSSTQGHIFMRVQFPAWNIRLRRRKERERECNVQCQLEFTKAAPSTTTTTTTSTSPSPNPYYCFHDSICFPSSSRATAAAVCSLYKISCQLVWRFLWRIHTYTRPPFYH